MALGMKLGSGPQLPHSFAQLWSLFPQMWVSASPCCLDNRNLCLQCEAVAVPASEAHQAASGLVSDGVVLRGKLVVSEFCLWPMSNSNSLYFFLLKEALLQQLYTASQVIKYLLLFHGI